jgi:hypothetical protein
MNAHKSRSSNSHVHSHDRYINFLWFYGTIKYKFHMCEDQQE